MTTRRPTQAIQSFLLRTVLPAVCLTGAACNLGFMVNGPDGLRAHDALLAKVEAREVELAERRALNDRLAARADGLLAASLDTDLFEERLRARLGLTRPEEYMVPMSDLDRVAGLETPDDEPLRFAELRPRGE